MSIDVEASEKAGVPEASSSQVVASVKGEEDVKPAAEDVKMFLVEPRAATDPKDEAPKAATLNMEVEANTDSSQALSVADASIPDIVGVIEERENEDLAVDDTEPAPMDDEERRRILNRPAEARDTSDVPVALPESNGIQRSIQAEGLPAKNYIANYHDQSLEQLQSASTSTGTVSKQDRLDKMNALRKKMVSFIAICFFSYMSS